MDKDTSITDILFPGVSLDCDLDGLSVASILRVDNEFILVLNTREDAITLVFGWDEGPLSATAVADMCEETLLHWLEKDEYLYLVGAVGKPYLLYANLLQGVCIPRTP